MNFLAGALDPIARKLRITAPPPLMVLVIYSPLKPKDVRLELLRAQFIVGHACGQESPIGLPRRPSPRPEVRFGGWFGRCAWPW